MCCCRMVGRMESVGRLVEMRTESHIHERAAHLTDGHDALFFAIHGLGKQGESLANLSFFFGGDVVFFRKLREARAGLGRGGGGSARRGAASGWLL